MAVSVFLLSSLVVMQGAAVAHPTSELIGRWRGTSICTKADWNAACHDEEALYDFKEGVAPGHVLSKGYKIVNGTPEYMGDLDFAWDPGAGAWVAEFAGPRIRSRWVFSVHGDTIDGRAVLLPAGRDARVVHVRRETLKTQAR